MSAIIPQNSTPILRNRTINLTQDVTTSPSSTTMSESCVSTSFPRTEDLVVRTHASAGFLATRKITIRSDPALLTCFDVADKQLYELWAPKT
ncbi:hypothetical protein EV363DRAFT_1445363 [Boletus edulis]|uniref:Uncharacterized protein n=1 Tax=Boletus edulis BED1 TaxID=1328754 RepID=A0AAD4C7R6_BOLED|nr:hypothetical protein EV363DRAFT_1445363 [Boletus edulis]KAF8450478.1 hypothetical protein L210DRAFT_2392162 [Boletus edulis BED1]